MGDLVFWFVVVPLVLATIWWLFFTPSGQKFRQWLGQWQKDQKLAEEQAKQKRESAKANHQRSRRGLNLNASVGTVTTCSYTENEMADLERDVAAATQRGWKVEQVAEKGGHINVGRTVAKVATGLIIFGASRSKGITIMLYTRVSK